jgi:anti-sigma regulatory factor (Ser/Thr protein kinase)
MDFSAVGKASTEAKRFLARLGLDQNFVKRIAIAMYEGEMNIAIHGGGGDAPDCRALAEDIVKGEAKLDDCIVRLRKINAEL